MGHVVSLPWLSDRMLIFAMPEASAQAMADTASTCTLVESFLRHVGCSLSTLVSAVQHTEVAEQARSSRHPDFSGKPTAQCASELPKVPVCRILGQGTNLCALTEKQANARRFIDPILFQIVFSTFFIPHLGLKMRRQETCLGMLRHLDMLNTRT